MASAVEARMRVMKAAAVPLPFAVDSRKARRKALMRPASTARMSQRRFVTDRHIGSTPRSAYRSHAVAGILEPSPDRRNGSSQ